ncbi:DUF1345 domain-containing protein [Azohydromonas caseinilytica]|nr:DUF1345 domain-containing protein [Azohydromonas caseinilytica]
MSRTLRVLRAHPRLWSSLAAGAAVYLLLPDAWVATPASRALIGWNAGALLYLGLAWEMMSGAHAATMRRRALQQDEGRLLVLTGVVLAAVAVMMAIASQLAAVKSLPAIERLPHLALTVLTVLSSWLFTQAMFALHYAHDFYAARERKQPDLLQFPGTPDPDYGDFFYFACVIGTSGQTADVAFTSSALRRIGTLHCILAFAFNTTVLALSVNIAAGLF